MRHHRALRNSALIAVAAAALAFMPCGCGSRHPEGTPIETTTTDQMFSDSVYGAELAIVIYDGRAILVPSGEQLDNGLGYDLEEGQFYRIVADVDYLYGGVAGYDGYPDIRDVSSIEEVSPDDLDIPTIDQQRYGVVRIDGYADADYLLYEYGRKAVLSDGEWVYRYDKDYTRDDGTVVLYRDGAEKDLIESSIADGVVCNEDFFLVPAQA